MRKFDPWPVFFKREWNRNWPFLVGFAVTGTIITKFSLGLTDEDAKNSPFVQRHKKYFGERQKLGGSHSRLTSVSHSQQKKCCLSLSLSTLSHSKLGGSLQLGFGISFNWACFILGPDDELFPAQEALWHIQTRIADLVPNKENIITTQLLVPSGEIGCLEGNNGLLFEMRKSSGINVQILPNEQCPVCASGNDELLQVLELLAEANIHSRVMGIDLLGPTEGVDEILLEGKAHGPSWLVGRCATSEKGLNSAPTDTYISDLTTKIRQDIDEVEEKLNKVQEEVDAKVNQKVQENLTWVRQYQVTMKMALL